MAQAAAKTAFVIMPFHPQFRAGYDDVIERGLRAAGLDAVRADQEALGHIHAMMFERIFESPVVIADISGANPNVFYELGVAHSAARRTITVVRDDHRDSIPFDIAPYQVLIYPKRPDESCSDEERAAYETASSEAAASLARAISSILEPDADGVDNPVQDFQAARSPVTCSESRHIDSLNDSQEEEMIANADSDIVVVGITCRHFTTLLCRVLEDERRSTPLRARLLALDPDDRDGWHYVYHLREGRALPDDEFDELFTEDRTDIQRTARLIQKLNKRADFDGELMYYTGVPIFWGYGVDGKRLLVGNLAMNRISARLPVTVLVEGDPRTRSLYRYYTSAIEDLGSRAKQVAAPPA